MAYQQLRNFGYKTDFPTYVIAEIGLNHGGDILKAKALIDSAASTGVDAVKFQTYITEKRAASDSPIFAILKECELSFEAFEVLKKYSESKGVTFFSTPFDTDSVDFLESINVEIYKLSSFDVVNNEMLEKVATTGKPVILSVGLSNIEEIAHAYGILKRGSKNTALLHCISAYPAEEKVSNLNAIKTLGETFDCIIGHSDHTPDIKVPIYAVAAGAQIIEKHFKIDATMECIDAPVSITEDQLRRLVSEIRNVETIMGDGVVKLTDAQKPCAQYRRFKEKGMH